MEMGSSDGSASSNLTNSGEKRIRLGTDFEDRISSLPDSILIHILSLLPTRDAVKTILIPRFGDLWNSIKSLEFDACSYHDCGKKVVDVDDRCLNLIRHALILHSSPTIYKFSLVFPFTYIYKCVDEDDSDIEEDKNDKAYIRKRKLANEVDTWISFSVRRKVKILYLSTKLCSVADPENSYVLPNVVLRSCFLTELHLVQCRLKPKGRIYMNSLKKLSLQEILLSDEVLHSILDGCPQLEYLSLHCYGLLKLNLTSACLTMLVICVWQSRNSKLELSCSNVRSLDISGMLDMVDLKNVSPLVNARLMFLYHLPCEEKKYHGIRGIFEKLRYAEVLNICTWCIMVFTIWELKTLPCPSFEWKHLVLETMLTKWHLLGIASLLRNSPHLESLKIEVRHGTSAFPDEQTKWLYRYDYDEANYWSTVEPFDCLINELKCVYIYANENGNVVHPHVIQLVKFLLKSSLVMEKIAITIKPDGEPQWTERLLEFTQELTSFPKASSRAVVLFI